jgi:hypothetical protein
VDLVRDGTPRSRRLIDHRPQLRQRRDLVETGSLFLRPAQLPDLETPISCELARIRLLLIGACKTGMPRIVSATAAPDGHGDRDGLDAREALAAPVVHEAGTTKNLAPTHEGRGLGWTMSHFNNCSV